MATIPSCKLLSEARYTQKIIMPETDQKISQQHHVCVDPIKTTFASPDLLLDIICHLIDTQSLPDLLSLSLVSTQFLQVIRTSETFWKELCHQRWRDKWGFHRRWEESLQQYHQTGERLEMSGSFWRQRYFEEELDAKRQVIDTRELTSLTFDFRFWIGQPRVVDERIVVGSGLLESASRDVRFHLKDSNDEDEQQVQEEGEEVWYTHRGEMSGHPCREPGIEWFMDESSTIQWGFRPNLWPKGEIRRVNWGWEIRNPNVVMRAIDPKPASLSEDVSVQEEGSSDIDNGLWKDLIDSLDYIPMRNAPQINGYAVTAELPRSMFEIHLES